MKENQTFTEELENQLQGFDSYISEEFSSVCEELSGIKQSDPVNVINGSVQCLSFKTCIGKKYTPAIRKLHYSSLAVQLPPGKIATIIKIILKSFFPDLSIDDFVLPKDRCVGCMQIDELTSVSQAHKSCHHL